MMQRIALSRTQEFFCLLIALMMIPLAGVGIDVYVAAIPAMTHYFNVDTTLIQLTVSLYLIGYAIGQFIFGTLTDTFGRKKMIIIGMLLFALTSFLITMAGRINVLLFLRLLQGFFVASAAIGARTIIIDIAEGMKLKRYTNYLTICWSLGPILAPVIGGYLATWFDWQTTFLFLVCYAAVIIIMTLTVVPETHTNFVKLHIGDLVNNYKIIISNSTFVASFLVLGVVYGIIVTYNIVGPYLIETVLGYSKIDFGHIGLALGVAVLIGNTLNRILIEHVKAVNILVTNMVLSFINCCVMLILALTMHLNLWILIIPVVLNVFFGGLQYPNCFAKCLSLFPKRAGLASAALGVGTILCASFFTIITSIFHTYSMIPLSVIYVSLTFSALLLYWFVLRKNFTD